MKNTEKRFFGLGLKRRIKLLIVMLFAMASLFGGANFLLGGMHFASHSNQSGSNSGDSAVSESISTNPLGIDDKVEAAAVIGVALDGDRPQKCIDINAAFTAAATCTSTAVIYVDKNDTITSTLNVPSGKTFTMTHVGAATTLTRLSTAIWESINVASGATLIINGNINFVGNTRAYSQIVNAGTLTIQNGNFYGADVTTGSGDPSVYNMTIDNTFYGGCIKNTGTLTMSGGGIYYHKAYNGGAIYSYGSGSSVTISGGTISKNYATYGGGAIAIHGNGTNSTPGTNTLTISGGCIGHADATGPNTGTTWPAGNRADYGGAIACDNGAIINITSGSIIANEASHAGGAIVSDDEFDRININGGYIKYNSIGTMYSGTLCGAGIYCDGILTMTGGTIEGNTTNSGQNEFGNHNRYGGGIMLKTSENNGLTNTISGGTIKENYAEASGGGIRVDGSLTITSPGENSVSINDNSASTGGGISVANGGTLTINGANVSVKDNTANGSGGGVYCYGAGTTFTLSSGKIKNNTAGAGGGVMINTGVTCTIGGGTISQNEATLSPDIDGKHGGGGIKSFKSTLTINGGQINNNTAPLGGGIFVEGKNTDGGVLTLNHWDIRDNTSTKTYGVCLTSHQIAVYELCNINIRNSEDRLDGGIYVMAGLTNGGLPVTGIATISSCSRVAAAPNNNVITYTGRCILIGLDENAENYTFNKPKSIVKYTNQSYVCLLDYGVVCNYVISEDWYGAAPSKLCSGATRRRNTSNNEYLLDSLYLYGKNTVTLDAGDGGTIPNVGSRYAEIYTGYGSQISARYGLSSLPIPTRSGYTFTGWAREDDLGTRCNWYQGSVDSYGTFTDITLHPDRVRSSIISISSLDLPRSGNNYALCIRSTYAYSSSYDVINIDKICFYDSDMSFLGSNTVNGAIKSITFTSSSNYAYMVIVCKYQNGSNITPTDDDFILSKGIQYSKFGTWSGSTYTPDWYPGHGIITVDRTEFVAVDHKLVATWKQFNVTLNANGGSIPSGSGWTGSGSTATKSVTTEIVTNNGYQLSTYDTLPTPTRTGYRFLGWTTAYNFKYVGTWEHANIVPATGSTVELSDSGSYLTSQPIPITSITGSSSGTISLYLHNSLYSNYIRAVATYNNGSFVNYYSYYNQNKITLDFPYSGIDSIRIILELESYNEEYDWTGSDLYCYWDVNSRQNIEYYDGFDTSCLVTSSSNVLIPTPHTLYASWEPHIVHLYNPVSDMYGGDGITMLNDGGDGIKYVTLGSSYGTLPTASGFSGSPYYTFGGWADSTDIKHTTRWQQGGIDSSGNKVNSTTLLRSGYISEKDIYNLKGKSFHITNGKINIKLTNISGSYLIDKIYFYSTHNSGGFSSSVTVNSTTYDYECSDISNISIIITIKRSDGGTITTSDLDNFNLQSGADGYWEDESTWVPIFNTVVYPYTSSTIVQMAKDHRLTAVWIPRTYQITYVANGTTIFPSTSPVTYEAGASVTLPTISRPGYGSFVWKVTTAGGNWTANATFSNGATVSNYYGNVTLTAQSSPVTYTITFQNSSGNYTGDMDYTIVSNDVLPTPSSRQGYTFNNWLLVYQSGSNWGTVNVSTFNAGTGLNGKYGDVALREQWTPNNYTITFKTGNNTMAEQSVPYGSTVSLMSESEMAHRLTDNDWRFYGWAETLWSGVASENEYDYSDGEEFTMYTTSGVTLYAIYYRPITFKYYDSASATSATSSTQCQFYTNTAASVASAWAVDTFALYTSTYNWAPLGWCTTKGVISPLISQTDSTTTTVNPASNAAAPTYYAMYERTVTLQYNGNGSTGGSTADSTTQQRFYATNNTSSQTFYLRENGFTKTGSTFQYWHPSSTAQGGGTWLPTGEYDPAGTAWNVATPTYTIYAIWAANWVVTYKTGSNTMATQEFSPGVAGTLTNVSGMSNIPVSDNGWSFYGWANAANTTTITYTNAQANVTITEDTTLYAIYSRSVTFKYYNASAEIQTNNSQTQYYRNTDASTAGASSVTAPALIAVTAGGTSWTAEGWRYDTTADEKELNVITNTSCTPDATKSNTLYGIVKRTLTLKYNGNGSDGGTAVTDSTGTQYLSAYSTDTKSTVSHTVKANTYTKTGYTANGWNANEAGTGTAYAANATYSMSPAYNSTSITDTIYSKWDANSYTITFEANNGTLTGTTTINAKYGVSYTISDYITNATRSGKAFAGWKVGSTSTIKSNTDSVSNLATSGTVTLTAQWVNFAYESPKSIRFDQTVSNALTNETGVTPTYGSSNTSVATINSSGIVTNVATGQTTISATVTYQGIETTTSYVLTITEGQLIVSASGWSGKYDGTDHGITVTSSPDATIKFGTASGTYNLNSSPTYVNVGTYTVYYQVSKTYYTTATGSESVVITERLITITANAQSIVYGSSISNTVDDVTISGDGLASGDKLTSVTLTPSTSNVTTTGTITPSAFVIKNSNGSGSDVTSNYTITPETGNLTITAQKLDTPTGLAVATNGDVTWNNVSNASSYQLSFNNGSTYIAATNGNNYLSNIIAQSSPVKVKVKAVGSNNYATSDASAAVEVTLYTVTISTSGSGSVSSNSVIVIDGSAVSVTDNVIYFAGKQGVTPTADTGWRFTSWSKTSGTIASSQTITATFTVNSYTVTYDPNDSHYQGEASLISGKTATQTYTYTETVDFTSRYNRAGYTFASWNTQADGNGTTYLTTATNSGLVSTHNGSITLYARWTPAIVNYTIKYYIQNLAGNGYTQDSSDTSSGATNTLAYATPKPFPGFTYSDTLSAETRSGYIQGDGSLVLELYYTRNSHNLTLTKGTGIATFTSDLSEANGLVSSSDQVYVVRYGASVSFSATAQSGYETITYSGAATSSPYLMGDADAEIVANASKLTYAVTYNKGDATSGSAPASQTKIYGESLTLQTNTGSLAKTGYAFAGWATSQGGAKAYDAGGSYTDNAALSLYPAWTANTYNITLDNANATTNGTATIYEVYGTGIYRNSGKTEAMTTSANNITIPQRVYTVTYTYNGATGGNSTASANATYAFKGYYDSTTQMINATGYITSSFTNTTYSAAKTLNADWTSASVTLPTPTKTGYTFGGWYGEEGLSTFIGNGGASYTPTSNVTIYAKWTANVVTITTSAATSGTFYLRVNGDSSSTTYSATFSSETSKTISGVANGTYYVWAPVTSGNATIVKSSATVTIEDNSQTVTVTYYTISRTQGTGTTLYTRYNSTSESTGTEITGINTATVVQGTSIWAKATLSAGYKSLSLKHGTTNLTASGDTFAVAATEAVISAATGTGYSVVYKTGNTTIDTQTGFVYGTNKALKTITELNFTAPVSGNGWSFAGWSTAVNTTTSLLSNGATVNNLSTTDGATVTLYAVYSRAITFKYYNASAEIQTNNSQTQYYRNTDASTASAGSVTAPALIALTAGGTSWAVDGWRYDTTADENELNVITNTSCTPDATKSNTLYGIVKRTLTLQYNGNDSDGGTAVTDSTGTQYLSANSTDTKSTVSHTVKANTYTKTGYTANGWNTNEAGTGTPYAASDTYSMSPAYNSTAITATIYSKWDVNRYKLTFNATSNGGAISGGTLDANNSMWVVYNTTTYYTTESGSTAATIPSATKSVTGYTVTFAGWYTAATSGTKVINADGTLVSTAVSGYVNSSKWINTEAKTLYAVFNEEANSYTITFITGSNTMATQDIAYGSTVALTAESGMENIPVSGNGWEFYGWATTYNTSTRDYEDGADYTMQSTTGVTLYAIYKRNVNFVTLKADGTTQDNNVVQYYRNTNGTTAGVTSVTAPAVTAYIANSWAGIGYRRDTTVDNKTVDVGSVTPTADGSATYYAIYNRTVYLAHNGNGSDGGTAVANTNTKQYLSAASTTPSTATLTVNANTYTRTGYTFDSWNTAQNGSGSEVSGTTTFAPDKTASGDGLTKTIYAKWTQNVVTINVKVGSSAYIASNINVKLDSGTAQTVDNTGKVEFTEVTAGSHDVNVSVSDKAKTTYTKATTITVSGASTSATVTYYTVTISVAESGYGTVTNSPALILSGAKLYQSAADEKQLLFGANDGALISTASPSATTAQYSYGFSAWKQTDKNGTAITTSSGYTIDGNKTVCAVFTRDTRSYAVTVTIQTMNTSGTYANNTAGGSVALAGTGTYTHGTIIKNQLTPSANAGFTFAGFYTDENGASALANDATITGAITIYARFSRDQHTLTINYQYTDESEASAQYSQSYYYEQSYSVTSPTITGYTPDVATVSGTMGTTNVTTTVTYSANQYNVTFNANKPSGMSSTITMTLGGSSTTTSPTTKTNFVTFDSAVSNASASATGWTFNGFFTEQTNGTKIFDADGTVVANATGYTTNSKWTKTSGATLYAQWTANQYNIVFDANKPNNMSSTITMTLGGVDTTTSPTTKTNFVTFDSAVSNASASATGWTFNGFFTEQTNGTKIFNADGTVVANATGYTTNSKWTKTSGATLYAQWTINSYQLTLNFVESRGTTTTVNVSATGNTAISGNTSVAVSGATIITANYGATVNVTVTANGVNITDSTSTFVSYFINTSSTNNISQRPTALSDYDRHQFTWNVGDDEAMYIFVARRYLLKFDVNGGVGENLFMYRAYANNVNLPTNTYTKTGYTPNAWNTSPAYTSTPAWGNNAVFSAEGNAQFYANYLPNTYYVHFDGNGATSGTMSNQEFTYDVAQNLTANAFVKAGYTFAGWAETANGAVVYTDAQSVSNLTSTANATVNLYAKWTLAIARIGNTYYSTFKDALDAVPASTPTIIYLINSSSENLSSTYNIANNKNINIVAENTSITINLGNYGLENQGILKFGAETGETYNDISGSTISANTLNNFTFTLNTSATSALIVNTMSTANLTINGGTFEGTVELIDNVSSANAIINGGNFRDIATEDTGKWMIRNRNSATMTINDADVNNVHHGRAVGNTSGGLLYVYGGNYYGEGQNNNGYIFSNESNTGVMHIHGGTYTAYDIFVSAWSGTVYIYGGTFNISDRYLIYAGDADIHLCGDITKANDNFALVNYASGATLSVDAAITGNYRFHYYSGIDSAPMGKVLVTFDENLDAEDYLTKLILNNSGYKTYADTTANTINLTKDFTLTVDAGDGTIPATAGYTIAGDSHTATKSVTYGLPYGTLPQPTREGYTFGGWYGKNLFDYVINNAQYKVTTVVNGSTIISTGTSDSSGGYSQFKVHLGVGTYAISIDYASAGTGDSSKDMAILWKGANAAGGTVKVIELTRNSVSSQTFEITTEADYWIGLYGGLLSGEVATYRIQIEKGNSATTIEPFISLTEVRNNTVVRADANHYLYAHWTPTSYTITYNTDGGNSISPLTYTIESTDVLPLPTKAGYSFNHWVVTTAGGNWEADATFANGTAVTGKWGDVTLTANWSSNGQLTIVSTYDTTGSDACDNIAMGFIDLTINGKVINLMLFSGRTYTITHVPYGTNIVSYVTSATVNHTAKVGASSTGTVTLTANDNSKTITVTINKTGYGTLHTSSMTQDFTSGVQQSQGAAHTAKAITTLKAMGIDLQYTDSITTNAQNTSRSTSTLSTEQIALIVVASILMIIGTTEIVIAKCTKPKRRGLRK